jgi:hypothetical protein
MDVARLQNTSLVLLLQGPLRPLRHMDINMGRFSKMFPGLGLSYRWTGSETKTGGGAGEEGDSSGLLCSQQIRRLSGAEAPEDL